MKIGTLSKSEVATIDRHATVAHAAAAMRHAHVGDLVVVDESGRMPVGIITDRDIVVEAIARGFDAAQIEVGSMMSSPLVMVGTEDEVTDVLRAMSEKGVRRAPVIDAQGMLAGIVSIEDLVGVIAAELARVTRLIRRGREAEVRKTEDSFKGKSAT